MERTCGDGGALRHVGDSLPRPGIGHDTVRLLRPAIHRFRTGRHGPRFASRNVPLLEAFNPGDKEIFHAVFVGGASMPARIRVFVDYLIERMGEGAGKAARRRAPSD